MSLQDPIADMLVRIKNAQAVAKVSVAMPKSKIKIAIAKVLQEEGYIAGFSETEMSGNPWMTVELKYYDSKPVIRRLERVSRSSLRVYQAATDLPEVENGLGIAIISTSQGVMTATAAKKMGQGGEVLCYVS
ncbi:MAG: 30S ribosomal protein S8 [uncultured bacterium]|nr:MAG: 30S ribosomal protein S8 [uncultured bacterium]OGT32664.1 MAG: 30S ribosomal protein S8 [Gammaproteobacteria bacterium RIFCSPHIGHO2_02_FULL_39_13]OGT48629.1 MAG: 30S ribosomal protein S8 [Gammaproteobacteria bacterium RIFCSPHIGHO2_12_FULL_39_24]